MDAFMAEDQRFHGLLGDATGNAVLAGMVQGQGQFLARHHGYRRTAPEALARNTEATVAEHAAILRALARRHADDAEAALRAHLGRAHALYQRRPRRAAPDNSASPA
jgi:DNA-binding GntR family transcriptional regulator